MKKRIIALLCLVATAVLMFAACTPEEDVCEHTFSEKWSSDAKNHWHSATCEHGEQKDSLAAHADSDEDGKCDVCEYNVGHAHTYKSEWTIDENKHWKDATCSHKDSKIEESLHSDEDANSECDVCKGHVHILTASGMCKNCKEQVKPIDKNIISMVISAAGERADNVKSGTVDYHAISRNKTENNTMEHKHVLEFLFGTNGTYSKRTSEEEIIEKFITIISPEEVSGYTTTKDAEGKLINAEPSAFSTDDLKGYYYAVSTLADGHGAEAVLLALYEISQDEEIAINYTEEHLADENKYSFSYGALVINTSIVNGTTIYNVGYYEVEVSFTYTDNFELTTLDILCDCYTNDPGKGFTESYDADIDLSYDPETDTFTLFETALADTYTFSVEQTIGEREEIALDDGSQYAPSSFEIYLDEAFTTVATELTVDVTNVDTLLYLSCAPENTFISFFQFSFDSEVTDKDGNAITGLMAVLVGDVIQILPSRAGEYVVTFEALGVTKTMNITVTAPEVKGEHQLLLEVTDSNTWDDSYTFVPETPGEYTFYFPVNFSVHVVGESLPAIDAYDYWYDATAEHSITVKLKPGEKFVFNFGAVAKGIYVIGYDAP